MLGGLEWKDQPKYDYVLFLSCFVHFLILDSFTALVALHGAPVVAPVAAAVGANGAVVGSLAANMLHLIFRSMDGNSMTQPAQEKKVPARYQNPRACVDYALLSYTRECFSLDCVVQLSVLFNLDVFF